MYLKALRLSALTGIVGTIGHYSAHSYVQIENQLLEQLS